MTNHSETTGPSENGDISQAHGRAWIPVCTETPETNTRSPWTPGELADALPYLLGYRPEDSIVLAALRDRDWLGPVRRPRTARYPRRARTTGRERPGNWSTGW
ncbi:hypothetical protein SVIOM342S_06643 [Streptomyces violaceorubidus]